MNMSLGKIFDEFIFIMGCSNIKSICSKEKHDTYALGNLENSSSSYYLPKEIFKHFTFCKNPNEDKDFVTNALDKIFSINDPRIQYILNAAALSMLESGELYGRKGLKVIVSNRSDLSDIMTWENSNNGIIQGHHSKMNNVILMSKINNQDEFLKTLLHELIHWTMSHVLDGHILGGISKKLELVHISKCVQQTKNNVRACGDDADLFLRDILKVRSSQKLEEYIADIGKIIYHGSQNPASSHLLFKQAQPLIDYFDNRIRPYLSKSIASSSLLGRVRLPDITNFEVQGENRDLIKSLHFDVKTGNILGVLYHCNKGVSLESTDADGYTPIFHVKHIPMFYLLKHLNCNLEFCTKKGEYPLQYAVLHKNNTLVKLLLKSGVKPNGNQYIYASPLEIAKQIKDIPTDKLLTKYIDNHNNQVLEEMNESITNEKSEILPYKRLLEHPSQHLIRSKAPTSEDFTEEILRSITYVEDLQKDGEFVKNAYHELLCSKDEAIQTLLKCIAKIALKKKFKIFIASSLKGENVVRMYQYHPNSKHYGDYMSKEGYCFISIPLKYNLTPKKNMFKRIILHEFCHAVFDQLGTREGELKLAYNSAYQNINFLDQIGPEEIKAHEFINWKVLQNISKSCSTAYKNGEEFESAVIKDLKINLDSIFEF